MSTIAKPAAKPVTKPTARFRELLAADGLIVAPFIMNAPARPHRRVRML